MGELGEEATADGIGMDCKGPSVGAVFFPSVNHGEFYKILKGPDISLGFEKIIVVTTEVEMNRNQLESYTAN